MHGVCHMDIPSRDFEKAKKFYGDLFNWEFTPVEEMSYLLFKAPDGVGGGFDQNLEFATKPGFLFYIQVEDVSESIKKAESIGGKMIKEKTQISPEFGYYGIVSDLEGNQIGLWSQN